MTNEQKQSQEELLEEYQLIIQASQNHLVDFEIATNPDYEPNWHHEAIARELEHIEKYGDRDYKVLMVFVPPRHGKSQMCSIDFPAWFLGKNPKKEIIAASYSAELAQDFGSKTREKVNSEEFKAIFPQVTLRPDEQARGKWRTKQGGTYVAVGVGGPITGRGADVLLIDDPIKNREEADSEVYREKTYNWFTSTAFTRLHPGGVVIVILTRWHMDDLAGRILQNDELKNRTKVISFPAVATSTDEHRNAGEALWPERYPIKSLNEIKATVGPYDWSSLYQCSPILTEDQEFKPQWFRPITDEELSHKNTTNYLTIDTAMSKRAQADFTGFCDNSVNQENFWHLKAWKAKIGPEELVDTIFSLYETRKYAKIGIEKTAYLDGLKPYLDEEQRKRGKFLPLVELHHSSTAKEIRIRGLIPRYAAGSVYHVVGRCKDLEEEMATFPVGVHDDVLDATAYQLQIAEKESSSVSIHRKVSKPAWQR